jgi:hypothetical protein
MKGRHDPSLGLPHWARNRTPRWATDEQAATPITNDNILKGLPKGSAIVTAPKNVIEYKPFDVSLRVAHKSLQDLLEDVKASARSGAEFSGAADIKMSRTMSAELVTADCIVEGVGASPWMQAITEDEDTIWPWRIHCDSAGTKQIALRLNTLIKIDGVDTPKVVDVAELPIEVHVDSLVWAMKHWGWLISTLLIPLVRWGAKQAFRDKNETPTKPA